MISEEFTIAQTAVKIISSVNFTQRVLIHNDHGNKVYLGGSDVSSSNGFHLGNDTNVEIEIPQDNELYAIAASGSGDVHVLRPA
jgi:hypothetical protein